MKCPLRKLLWITTLALVVGCAGAAIKWGQFHGGLSSQGFQGVNSGFALSSAWISEPYKITSCSPVLGKDFEGKEVLYVGTTDARLVAIDTADGSQKWSRRLGGSGASRIVSSPAVSEKGDIYIITNREMSSGGVQSALQKVDQFSNPKWSYTFPDNGFTSGSPKVFTSGDQTFIFVYVLVGARGEPQAELFVLRDDQNQAELLDRQRLGECRYDITGSGPGLDEIFDILDATWDLIANFPVEFNVSGIPLPDTFVDPTPAIATDRERLLIAIADNLCSLGAYEWDGMKLSAIWGEAHDFKKHSSTALLPNELMVFGRNDGMVLAYDARTGVKMWEYDAGEPVLATPAASPTGQFVFVVSKSHIHVVRASDGTIIHDSKLELLGQTHASPAATANRVYVSTGEMLTLSYDLKTRGHDTNFHGNGLSSVAVSSNGDVYAVGIDGTIRKYKGTN
ncbi:MAG: PQQ-binding-like beta-propeller repeat protein [Desulfobacterales bacterium]|nr:MAG: PQQ-binding-like beta-propeller repeat protein [Desulfobacterales bacterium]